MLTENQMMEALRREAPRLPPLVFFLREDAKVSAKADAVFDIGWNGRTFRFVAEVKARATPQALAAAAQQIKSVAYDLRGGYAPLLIVPYLSDAHLEQVDQMQVSAVDLCGNGVVRGANEFYVRRSGQPNQFKESRALRAVYRGTTSLVARALVLRPRFERVSDARDYIVELGGRITLGTVSKALSRLEEDLIIARTGKAVSLLQPAKLLDALRAGYQAPRIEDRWTGKIALGEQDLGAAFAAAADRTTSQIVLTGMSAAPHHVTIATEPVSVFYCTRDPRDLLEATGLPATPTRGFPNVELLRTHDQLVYFDARRDADMLIASPIQTWLELATGDKRSAEAGAQLREGLLRGANDGG